MDKQRAGGQLWLQAAAAAAAATTQELAAAHASRGVVGTFEKGPNKVQTGTNHNRFRVINV